MKNSIAGATDGAANANVSAIGKPTGRRKRARRRRRVLSLNGEIRQQAKQIQQQGMSEAFKAAALMICARKLDEVKSILAVAGLSGVGISQNILPGLASQPPPTKPLPPSPIENPCVQCGRSGVYKSKPSQWNPTGSWWCQTHKVLAYQTEAEDRIDRSMPSLTAPIVPSSPPPMQNPQRNNPVGPTPPSPGAGSLQEAMGLAEVVE